MDQFSGCTQNLKIFEACTLAQKVRARSISHRRSDLPYSDGAYRIPRPIYFSVQFKHMVLGLHIILAAEEDRTSDLASLFLVDLPMGLPRLESFR